MILAAGFQYLQVWDNRYCNMAMLLSKGFQEQQ